MHKNNQLAPFADFPGTKLGRLTLVRASKVGRVKTWFCKCDCGGKGKSIPLKELHRGVRSCGCLVDRLPAKEPTQSRMPEYQTHYSLIRKCTAPHDKEYINYGARGIKVCQRWTESFEAFLEDMGPRPSTLHRMQRENIDKDFTPENCYWETTKVYNERQRAAQETLQPEHAETTKTNDL